MLYQKGQILLIVVLVVIVTSTIGLSLASRSIIGIRTSTEEADSQKALAAAEAGIERAIQGSTLSTGLAILNGNLSNNADYRVDVEGIQDSSFLINGGNVIPKDEGADVWFVNHDTNSKPDYSTPVPGLSALASINLYWKSPSGSPPENCLSASTAPPAIEAIVVARTSSTDIKTYRYAYDKCSSERGNNFTQTESGSSFEIGGLNFTNKTPAGNGLATGGEKIVMMRIVPIYKDAVIAIEALNGGGNPVDLPSQGYVISSTGESGAANRKLTVFKGYPQIYLPYLSYGLFVASD